MNRFAILIMYVKGDVGMICNVLDYLERSAARQPEKDAVVDENKRYTYEQLRLCSARIGTALSGIIAPGSLWACIWKNAQTYCLSFSEPCMQGAFTPCSTTSCLQAG